MVRNTIGGSDAEEQANFVLGTTIDVKKWGGVLAS